MRSSQQSRRKCNPVIGLWQDCKTATDCKMIKRLIQNPGMSANCKQSLPIGSPPPDDLQSWRNLLQSRAIQRIVVGLPIQWNPIAILMTSYNPSTILQRCCNFGPIPNFNRHPSRFRWFQDRPSNSKAHLSSRHPSAIARQTSNLMRNPGAIRAEETAEGYKELEWDCTGMQNIIVIQIPSPHPVAIS